MEQFFKELPKKSNYKGNDNSMAVLGDALESLKLVKDSTVDLVFADPPYNLGKDFAGSKFKMDTDLYIDWCKDWIKECMRILKPNGTMYFMTATQFMPYLDIFAQENYHVLSRIVWTYDSSGVQARKSFGSLYEPIIRMSHNSKSRVVFNADEIMVEAKTGGKRGLIDYRKDPPQPYNTKKVPGNVWEYPRVRFKMDEYESHPSQKPEALMERIILASSNKGDLVLDPFGGTFATSAVAQKLGRKTISIELFEDYYKIGLRRLGLANTYKGEKLVKEKPRKTKNKSKYVREAQV